MNLDLTTDQQEELLSLAAQFNKELEDPATPPFPKATTLQALKEKLKAALIEQKGFSEIWAKAQTTTQLLCLSHEKTAIRNLPWQIATDERPLLAIAKSSNNDLLPHQPSIGYPLKVLVMVASPEGVTRLAYEEEELQLLRAFSPLMSQGLAQVHFTDDGSLENLAKKLTENSYHILHFTGHGSYHKGKGTLALEDPISGKLKEVSAVKFNEILAKAGRKGHRPELVVFSACQTAQGVEAGDLSGVADTLMQGGIPSVIAMSASILDNCAAIFVAKLYAELSDGLPLPDAFQEARLEVRKFEMQFDLAKKGLAPGQWLIPQLLLNTLVAKLADENSPKDTLDFKQDVKIIRGETALVNLRVRPDHYVFVGRRKEKRTAMLQLKDGHSILLRGQGGVGKTALAEHLAIRLLAANQRIKIFTFSEKAPAGQSLLDQMQNYLTKEKKQFSIVSELAVIPKQTDKFFKLLQKVSERCDPVFLFDNIESFQKFDAEKQIWIWHQEKHEDILQLMQILDTQTSFPLIITGRYPIAEFPDLETCNMNTAPFEDFFKKCLQLGIRELAQKLRTGSMPSSPLKRVDGDQPPTFEEVIRLLHKTFGGNYRALEFFDELYAQKGEEIFKTLHNLADFQNKLEEKEIKEGVLTRMSENLIIKEMLTYLNAQDKDTLFVLAQFNIPVLPMAIGMQRNNEDRTKSLHKAVNLTLMERQKGVDGKERFYVMPLVRDLLKESGIEFKFEEKVAGDYHKYAFDNDLEEDWVVELSAAFERYFVAQAVEEINYVGWRLCDFYYDIQQFRLSLAFGLRTEEIAQEKTYGNIWNNIGLIFKIFGQLDSALKYYKKSLEDYTIRADHQGKGTALNNISQIYSTKGDYDTALQFLQQSLKIQEEIGDRQGEGTTLNNLATTAHAKGDYDTALQFLQQSLKIRQEIGDRQGEGTSLNNISQIHHAKGDYDTALQYLQQSLKIQKEIGDRQGEGTTLNNLTTTAHAKGDSGLIAAIQSGSESLLDYMKEPRERLFEARVLVLGEPRAGKTTLRRKLLDVGNAMPTPQESTKAFEIEIEPYECDIELGEQKEQLRYHLWDFGGQDYYRLLHQLFVTEQSVYIIVVGTDRNKTEEELEFWLDTIERLGKDERQKHGPVILLQNPKNNRAGGVFTDLKSRYPFWQQTEDFVINLDAINKQEASFDKSALIAFRGFEKYLNRSFCQLEHVGKEIPAKWIAVREALLEEKGNWISIERFNELCIKNEIKDKVQRGNLLNIFRQLGYLLHYKNTTLKGMVILNTEWVTDALYRVLDDPIVDNNQGWFMKGDVEKIWYEEKYENRTEELLALMQEFKLCYQNPTTGKYIVPSKLPSSTDNLPTWDATNNVRLRLQYDWMPKALVIQLLVSLHEYIVSLADGKQWIWRKGAVLDGKQLELEGVQVRIKDEYHKEFIAIDARGTHSESIIRVIMKKWREVNEPFKDKVEVTSIIVCPCARCLESKRPTEFNYHDVLRAKEQDKPQYCNKSFESLAAADILKGVYDETTILIDSLNEKKKIYSSVLDLIRVDKLDKAIAAITSPDYNVLFARRLEQLNKNSRTGTLSFEQKTKARNALAKDLVEYFTSDR